MLRYPLFSQDLVGSFAIIACPVWPLSRVNRVLKAGVCCSLFRAVSRFVFVRPLSISQIDVLLVPYRLLDRNVISRLPRSFSRIIIPDDLPPLSCLALASLAGCGVPPISHSASPENTIIVLSLRAAGPPIVDRTRLYGYLWPALYCCSRSVPKTSITIGVFPFCGTVTTVTGHKSPSARYSSRSRLSLFPSPSS